MSRSISKLGSLMGLDEEKIYNESKAKFTNAVKASADNELEKVKKSFENGTIDERHRNIIDFCKKTLHTFKNCDQVLRKGYCIGEGGRIMKQDKTKKTFKKKLRILIFATVLLLALTREAYALIVVCLLLVGKAVLLWKRK